MKQIFNTIYYQHLHPIRRVQTEIRIALYSQTHFCYKIQIIDTQIIYYY